MAELFDPDFFRQMSRLKLRTGTASRTSLAGLRKSTAKGSSVEFSDFREYLPGDDIRRLDWNAYARFGKLYLKLFREEKEGMFTIFTDLSQSMDYGAAPKSAQALRITAVLSRMALENQDRVKICLCGLPQEEPPFPTYRSFHGSAAFGRVLEYLQRAEDLRERMRADVAGTEPDVRGKKRRTGTSVRSNRSGVPGESGISGEPGMTGKQGTEGTGNVVWEAIRRCQPPIGGTSILISDFFPAHPQEKELSDMIRFLRGFRKQSVLLLQILSQEERKPEFTGTSRLLDMENDGGVRVTLTPGLLRTYEKTLRKFLKDVEETASGYQCGYQQIASEETVSSFLYRGMNVSWERL